MVAGATICTTNCTKADIDNMRKGMQEQDDRINSLEEWKDAASSDIEALNKIVKALQDKDYVTAVTPLEDGTGYTISFLKSGDVTIKHGTNGTDGKDGKDGDSIFAKDGIDTTSDPDNVILTLVDGSTITLPKALNLSVGFTSYDCFTVTQTENEVEIVLPEGLKESDYTAITAEIKNAAGTGMDIITKADAQPWKVTLTEPAFVDGKYTGNAKVTIEPSAGTASGDKAILKVTVINGKGKEISVSRAVDYFKGIVVNDVKEGELQQAVAKAIENSGISEDAVAGIRVNGSITDTDFDYMREHLKGVEYIDLSGTDFNTVPWRAFCFYDEPNTVIKEIVLPEGVTTIEDSAFAMCKALEKLNIPSTVTNIGRWILEGSKQVKTITIPAGVTEICRSCFYDAGLTSIDIPSTVTSIGNWAFDNCPLEKVFIPATVTSLGIRDDDFGSYTFGCSRYFEDNSLAQLTEAIIEANVTEIPSCCFAYQEKLAKISLPATVKIIGSDAFSGCPIESTEAFDMPAALEEIGPRAFAGSKFTSVTFHDKVSKIGCSAFNMVNLATIDLPASITSINATAFVWKNATTFICRATAVPEIPLYDDWNNKFSPFYGVKKGVCKVQVPAESLQAYKDAWGEYFGEENISAIE